MSARWQEALPVEGVYHTGVVALVSAVLAVGSVVGTILAWWGHFWSTGRRIHYTLVTLAALAFAWELVYWNLLGFRA